ncbi:MAG: prepilin-type N-terminal cleavage/methylation domain-containing protein, partial [Planctomycetales bacterium]|nr:prepilin-type N-terminal cleavage/methylation domain-containing protein [Planctomycetales bacterium]
MPPHSYRPPRRSLGFTLVELLVVIAIIGVL